MLFYSTNGQSSPVSFREAVLKGLAPDGGLFMPEKIPRMRPEFFARLREKSLVELSMDVAKCFVEQAVADEDLSEIIADAFYFDAPVVKLGESLFTLELFHGPTLAFKDFGARFMARLMSYFMRESGQDLTVLVATSGDTGGAVADGFWNVDQIRVVILYPSGKVSEIQEKQLTTLGGNITAVEIQGTFDDCQRLVKDAFIDPDLNRKRLLTSANSINISRLLPQSFYYFRALGQIPETGSPVVFSVPSGNYGNLTAGLIAKRMGLPISQFVAASNRNDVVPEYLRSGKFEPRPSIQTISNAMDVGNPSNFARIVALYDNNIERIRADIIGLSFSDEETRTAIREIHDKYGYLADPHGAVAYLGLRNRGGVFLETAHPAKFVEIVEPIVQQRITMPGPLQRCLKLPKQSIRLSNDFNDLKAFLLSHG